MTTGQQIVADWKRRYLPADPPRDRLVIRDDNVAFYATDGERTICVRLARRTEEGIYA